MQIFEEDASFIPVDVSELDETFLEIAQNEIEEAPVIEKKQDKIDQLKAQNDRLKTVLRETNETKKNKKQDFEMQFGLVRKGISDFFKLMVPTNTVSLQIDSGYYADYPNRELFRYPDASGFYIVRPVAILYGKGRYPARFVMAVGDDSAMLRFRWYPKSQFVGVPITDPRFSLRSAVWLIGCDRANDGAMDIVAAFPLSIEFRYHEPGECESEEIEK